VDPRLDQRFFPLIFNTISHGIFTIDANGIITSFNRAAERITGYQEIDALGKRCSEIFRAGICEIDCPLRRSIENQERTEDREVTVLSREGKKVPITISTAPLISPGGRVVGGVEMFRDMSALAELRKRLDSSYTLEDIVTKSPAMRAVLDMLPLVANSQSNVLIQGESGTGKELVARAIHNLGPRRRNPFIAVNCAAVPETLLESELFGYKKGAFTDAKRDKLGRFALAEKGTLFLDEIADLSPAMQAKLLRVLEYKQYEPLGATQSVRADVRIVTATNKDLAEDVRQHRFRQDLYFRLNVVFVHLPSLRERREDIPLLVNHFLQRFNALQGRRISRCSERVMGILMNYEFPGNVRELENAIEHAFVVCVGETIQRADLPRHLTAVSHQQSAHKDAPERPLQHAEADAIRAVLGRHQGKRRSAAAELGISRATLWRKMRRLAIS